MCQVFTPDTCCGRGQRHDITPAQPVTGLGAIPVVSALMSGSVSVAGDPLWAMSLAAYVRVSTGHQSHDQQTDAITAAGITPDRTFTDTASGRTGSERPGFTECMGWLRSGDILVVVAVDRLGRSVREIATALHELTESGITLRSLREGVDTSTATGRAVVAIMASVAELELELGRERRTASRQARIARGLPATCPPKLNPAQQHRLIRLYQQGEPVAELAALFNVSRRTVFRTLSRQRDNSFTPC